MKPLKEIELTGFDSENFSTSEEFTTFYFMPGFRLTYPYKSFDLGISCGLSLGQNDDTTVEGAYANLWNGVRVSVIMMYKFY